MIHCSKHGGYHGKNLQLSKQSRIKRAVDLAEVYKRSGWRSPASKETGVLKGSLAEYFCKKKFG